MLWSCIAVYPFHHCNIYFQIHVQGVHVLSPRDHVPNMHRVPTAYAQASSEIPVKYGEFYVRYKNYTFLLMSYLK